MSHVIGKIPVSWTLEEIESLDYFYEPFNDPMTMEHWKQAYQRDFNTGLQCDYRRPQPPSTQTVLSDLQQQGYDLNNIGTSYYKMLPGDILPYHRDTYASYCKYHSVSMYSITRIIVFLQDWQPGFLFEIEGVPMTKYPAGTFVAWKSDAPHMAGNLGHCPRYTLQITGTTDV